MKLLRPARSLNRLKRSFPFEAPAVSLLPLPLRLLPGGANQFQGGILTHCGSAPFHGAPEVMEYGIPSKMLFGIFGETHQFAETFRSL